jgi:cell division protein FtsQ
LSVGTFGPGELLSGYVPGLGVGGTRLGRYDRLRRFFATLAQGLRSGNLFSKGGSTVLDAPELDHAQMGAKSAGLKRGAAVTEMPLRRDSPYADDYADSGEMDAEFARRARKPGIRVSFRGGVVPKTRWGKIVGGCGLLAMAGASIAGLLWVRSLVLHDAHFVVPDSESIQIAGNSHLTGAQLLSVFGEDVDRNIFTIPLGARRAELESLPWVEHATVMRLLPNRVRVAIVERTPVAFVRQGARIGLVDVHGMLFDLPGPDMEEASGGRGAAAGAHYSFPVLTGISTEDPLSVRAARMKIYLGFVAALDASGEGISHKLSEVDLSNPEDVKAIIPDRGTDLLVHFGEEKFLERYRQYQAHLAEWRAQYPKLASVDMRYERQVVLQMQPGAAIPANAAGDATGTATGGADAVKPQPEAAKAAAAGHAVSGKAKYPAAAIHKPLGVPANAAGKAFAPGAQVQGAPR